LHDSCLVGHRKAVRATADEGRAGQNWPGHPSDVGPTTEGLARQLLGEAGVGAPMLKSLKELDRYSIQASDGDVGSVADFLFDDDRWAIRYLVVETGTFFDQRNVLISPISFGRVDWPHRVVQLALTREQVKGSPGVDTDQPVSRQHEEDYYRYYGYPFYWGAGGLWGSGNDPSELARPARGRALSPRSDGLYGDVHLRSAREVSGYHIQGSDDGIGTVADLLVDDATWAVRYLVVETGHWWAGHQVLVAPEWATGISFDERKVFVDMTRAAIQASPTWVPSKTVQRDYEARLHEHHGRTGYWSAGEVASPATGVHSRAAHEAEGGAAGAIAGAVLGSVAGPPGALAGAILGAVAGTLAGAVLDGDSSRQSSRTRKLDSEIGVTSGNIGATNLRHPPSKRGAYSGASAGVDPAAGEEPAEGPMQAPEN
jgi:uncharacterized protein YrrD